MRQFHHTLNRDYCPTVNVNYLWSLLPEAAREKFLAQQDAEKVPVIDVTQSGYFKVLGNGHIPKIPIIVKAKFFSKKAEAKIKAAGGVCVLTA